MRLLLTFIGSIIYLVVMTIISPLLVSVYAGLESVEYLRRRKQRGPIFTFHLPQLKILAFHISLKKQFASLWSMAARFHL